MSDFLASCDVSPIAKAYNQSRAQHTTVGSQARVKVDERRIKAALDNVNKVVGEMPQAFCDHFFPFPSYSKHSRPVIKANPFERLEKADDMLEADLTEIFVSDLVLGLHAANRSAPSLLSLYRSKSSTSVISLLAWCFATVGIVPTLA